MRIKARDRRCSYVVVLENGGRSDVRELARYLSTLGVANCDVVVLDASPRFQFELNRRVLCWVARHVAVQPEHCTPIGLIDRVRAASSLAACEKVIVASEDVRYTSEAIRGLCELLESHEVVEPQDYLDPLPWWGSIDAGSILIHRGIEPQPDHGATFGFRRAAMRTLRVLHHGSTVDDPVRRLVAAGAEVHAANEVFVRRQPGTFDEWLEHRPRLADDDFSLPFKTAFFFSLVPVLLLLGIFGGLQLAALYAGMIAFSSIGLALHGRVGAGAFFPMRTCLFAPLWVFERSLSVYWALFRRMRGAEADAQRVVIPAGIGKTKVASGE
jgi:hypothetical protein